MMRQRVQQILLSGLVAALAACAAPTTPVAEPRDEASCKAQGGNWRTVGMMQTEACEIRYPDAGKTCTDGSQCAGGMCLTDAATPENAGARTTGVCQPTNMTFGCFSEVKDGVTQPGLCAD